MLNKKFYNKDNFKLLFENEKYFIATILTRKGAIQATSADLFGNKANWCIGFSITDKFYNDDIKHHFINVLILDKEENIKWLLSKENYMYVLYSEDQSIHLKSKFIDFNQLKLKASERIQLAKLI